VATVARLLPRHWDGRRLLQFLTGLALIALAFAVPTLQDSADQPAEAPVTIITTVDTPFPAGLPVVDVPARPDLSTNKTYLAMVPEGHTAGSTTATAPGAEPAAGSDPGSQPAGVVAEPAAGSPAVAGADPAAAGTDPGSPAAGPRSKAAAAAAAQHAAALQGAQTGGYGPGSTGLSTVPGETGLPVQAWNGGRRICFEGRGPGSGAQGAHGERGPPRI
jgi:hypothetical protein